MRLFRILGYAPAVLLSSPVWAEENVGLPQLDTSLFLEQLFWLAIIFSLFYALMAYIALPRVAHTQRKRKHIITAEIKTAHAANDDAKHTIERVEKILKAARAKAQADVMSMIAEVTEATTERRTAQEKELMRRLHSAEATIVVAREAALASLDKNVADLAVTITEKIIGSKVPVSS